MRSLKNIVCLATLALVLSGCGGGSETTVSLGNGAAPATQSEYDLQTKAARDQFEARLAKALEDANSWMDTNRRETGVVTTQSGLQYRIDTPSPNPSGLGYQGDETVVVHYEGRLTDGTVFDSSFSRGRPEYLKPSELIQGWQEVLTLMKPGDEWTVFIPPTLGYGDLGKGGAIPANAVLIFKIKLR